MLQIALLTGLFPLTVLIFGRFSVLAPAMNLLVLPIFNFITVPFCLVGMIMAGPLQPVGDQLLVLSHCSIQLVLSMVSFVAGLPLVKFEINAHTGLIVAIACLPAIHVLLPAGWPGRRLALIAIAVVVCYRPQGPPSGCLDYHVLDVGQGLAVVLRAGDQTLLFDSGPSFRNGSNTAEIVVIPFLRSLGINRLQTLIVSHADQDHAGGMQALAAQFEIGNTLVGEFVADVDLEQSPCAATLPWTANGIHFEFLHPPGDANWEGNNASCVLEITTGRHKMLLTGDIEAPVEAALLRDTRLSRVDVVIVPHHGSRTSSSQRFVDALAPELAIVSAGFGNRWGFPKDDVARRWEVSGARLLDTANAGAVSQRVCAASGSGALRLERQDGRKYWH
jgi:competence protein ComEC